ncbi:hypothetical protein G6713_02200 [Polynucleobacter paneuropaeus]|nr:hypothetical protein G6713_02200 [Polynucleobacter paneuropaeus]
MKKYLFILLTLLINEVSALSVSDYQSKLIGRWFVNNDRLCSDPAFSNGGLIYSYDKKGQLISELNLPKNSVMSLIRISQVKKFEVIDDSQNIVKVLSNVQSVDKNEFYTTLTISKFDNQFKTFSIIDQKKNDEMIIKNSINLKSGERQSPFYKCD